MMSMMTLQMFNLVDSPKIQKSKYLENETKTRALELAT